MDPIIRAATVTALRRPLGRPGVVQSGLPAALDALQPVTPALLPPDAPPPDPSEAARALLAGIAADAAATAAALAAASVVLTQAEEQRRVWQAEEAAARALLHRERADLARREQMLQAERKAHQDALEGAHDEAAQRGHEDGLARGVAEGRAGADAAAAARLIQLDALALGMEQAAGQALARHEDLLVEVAWSAICRLAGELAASRDGALAMVHAAMSQVRDGQALRVRMHPQDAAWLAAHGEPGRWSLHADAAVALGGCIVDGVQGSLDARLELQLERLRAALVEVRAARAGAASDAAGMPAPEA